MKNTFYNIRIYKIFNEYIGDVPNLSEKLSDYDVLCLMRERTPLPGTLINKLPNFFFSIIRLAAVFKTSPGCFAIYFFLKFFTNIISIVFIKCFKVTVFGFHKL